MRFYGSLVVPAGTAENSPVTQVVKLSRGYITEVEIMFKPGPAWLVYLAIDRYEQQLYPLNRGEGFIGDDQRITFTDYYPLIEPPFSLVLRGWAPSTSLDHTVYAEFTIEPLAAIPVAALSTTVELPEGF